MSYIYLYLIFLFSAIGLSGAYAQQAVLSASGEDSGITGSISFSIGQIAYVSSSDTGEYIIQGVQQPYEIQFFPGVEERSGMGPECSVYPNPTSGEVTLKIDPCGPINFRYRLADIRGNLLSEQQVENCQQLIPMESLSPGTYFLTIRKKETILKTYKIIKR